MQYKKIIIFNGKQFYNARHLYEHLQKNYKAIHDVTYLQVREATGKRLKSIDKFYNVSYEVVSKTDKAKLKRWMQISEGYEEIIAFRVERFDDFIINYLGMKPTGYLFVYRNTKKQVVLAYKEKQLMDMAQRYNRELAGQLVHNIKLGAELRGDYYHYVLNPTPIKQNIF